MTWPFGRRRAVKQAEIEREARYEAMEAEIASLRERAERVADSLAARNRRNHWSETVRETVRRRS